MFILSFYLHLKLNVDLKNAAEVETIHFIREPSISTKEDADAFGKEKYLLYNYLKYVMY